VITTSIISLNFFLGIFSESVSVNVFAHELGHSLGAKHDDRNMDCNPTGEQSFLMTGNSKVKLFNGRHLVLN